MIPSVNCCWKARNKIRLEELNSIKLTRQFNQLEK